MSISFNPATPQLVFPGQFQRPSFSYKSHYYYSVSLPPITLTHCFSILNPTTTTTTTGSSSASTSAKMPVSRYLIERLGFSEAQSLTVSSKLINRRTLSTSKTVTDLIPYENADTVTAYLQEYCGLDLSQVKKLVTKYPAILATNVDKTIKPKIKLLQDLGFTTSDLALVLPANPKLYLQLDLGPVILTLRGIMGNDDEYVVKVLKQMRLRTANGIGITGYLIPNLNMLENEFGISNDKLRKFLTKSPNCLLGKTEWLRDVLVRMEDKWGVSRDSAQFLRALHVFSSNGDENINSKCQVFRSYGWSDSDILTIIRKFPSVIGLSETRLKKKLEFFMIELGYEPAYVANQPTLLGFNLENRVVPRHRVLEILKEKELIKADYKLCHTLALGEDKFFKRYIQRFENDVPKLREVYING